jgi:hypothetical protein
MNKTRDNIIGYSYLAPTPQLYYHKHSNTVICYWQGCAMTMAHALVIIQEIFCDCYITPKMREKMFRNFKQAYLLGAFGSPNWDQILENMSATEHLRLIRTYVQKNNTNLFAELTESYTIKNALLWFSSDYISTLGD